MSAAAVALARHGRSDGRSSFMRFFLAGIMQGSHLAAAIHPQGYRGHLRELIERYVPGADIYDPLAGHADSLTYDDAQGRSVFFHHCELCREVDVVLAFVPEASMGTAIEMWEARRAGRVVVVVSPMVHNWVVKFVGHIVYRDVDELEAALESGDFARKIDAVRSSLSADNRETR
jgi:hypothetical protein